MTKQRHHFLPSANYKAPPTSTHSPTHTSASPYNPCATSEKHNDGFLQFLSGAAPANHAPPLPLIPLSLLRRSHTQTGVILGGLRLGFALLLGSSAQKAVLARCCDVACDVLIHVWEQRLCIEQIQEGPIIQHAAPQHTAENQIKGRNANVEQMKSVYSGMHGTAYAERHFQSMAPAGTACARACRHNRPGGMLLLRHIHPLRAYRRTRSRHETTAIMHRFKGLLAFRRGAGHACESPIPMHRTLYPSKAAR